MPDSLTMILERLEVEESTSASIDSEVRNAYTANGLPYHNLDHIYRTLIFAAGWRHLVQDFTAVSLALWFHDIVYDPRAADNEEQSAEVARRLLGSAGLEPPLIERTAALILVTKHHRPDAHDNEGGLTADADLATLASSPISYESYSRAIRREYDFVDDESFRAGRIDALLNFLNRPTIFFHPVIRRLYEGQARRNITREIAALRSLK